MNDKVQNFRIGVGMVVLNKENKVFVGKKKSINTKMVSWFLKKPWQMPQGGIEEGETPTEAVLRELMEEIGTNNVEILAETEDWLEYKVPHGLRRKAGTYVGQRQKWFLLRFLGEDKEINLYHTNHKEFDGWRWMNTGNVIRLAVHFKRGLYINVFKDFKPYFTQIELSHKI